jgi:hypothetical protein
MVDILGLKTLSLYGKRHTEQGVEYTRRFQGPI